MIQNRTPFLNKISASLNRTEINAQPPVKEWQHRPVEKKLSHLTSDELMPAFIEQCGVLKNTTIVEVEAAQAMKEIDAAVQKFGGQSVALWDDERLTALGIEQLTTSKWIDAGMAVHIWDSALGRTENFERTNASNIGIAYAEYALAESGTVVLYSAEGQGKAVGLLPNVFITIVKKSTLLPRMTQAAIKIKEDFAGDQLLPASVDFISGPSNSADIEMDLVVGVHGPIFAHYIVLSDQ